jgi:hypothetical protein
MAYDLKTDVARLNTVGNPFIARMMLGGLFGLYGRVRVQQELCRQAGLMGAVSIATAPGWQRSGKPVRVGGGSRPAA